MINSLLNWIAANTTVEISNYSSNRNNGTFTRARRFSFYNGNDSDSDDSSDDDSGIHFNLFKGNYQTSSNQNDEIRTHTYTLNEEINKIESTKKHVFTALDKSSDALIFLFCKCYLTSNLFEVPSLSDGPEKWTFLFAKIENSVQQSFEEIQRIYQAIKAGYLIKGGFPQFAVSLFIHENSIDFGHDEYSDQYDYIRQLIHIAKDRVPQFSSLLEKTQQLNNANEKCDDRLVTFINSKLSQIKQQAIEKINPTYSSCTIL